MVEALRQQQQAIIDGYIESGDPIPPTVAVQLLTHLSPQDALAIELENPGTIDIAYLNAVIGEHDAAFFPGDPIDPEIEHLRDLRDEIVGDLTEDVDGPIDWDIAAIAQRNDISYEEAELAIEVNAIDELNDQVANIPSPQGAATAREQRDNLILDFLDGDELLAAEVGRFMSQGHSFSESLTLAGAQQAQAVADAEEEDDGYFQDIPGGFQVTDVAAGLRDGALDGLEGIWDLTAGAWRADRHGPGDHWCCWRRDRGRQLGRGRGRVPPADVGHRRVHDQRTRPRLRHWLRDRL